MAAATKTIPTEQVLIKPLNIREVTLKIEGTAPLVMHKWSEKAKKEILDKQMGKTKVGKNLKNPEYDYWQSMYHFNEAQESHIGHIEGNRYGFPAVAFKCAMVTAVTSVGSMTKVQARQCFYIQSDFKDLVEIHGVPTMREDMVRVGMGSADIRYRGEFAQWHVFLNIKFNADVISMDNLINLLNLAGFGVGIGEWRSEKDGVLGAFQVAIEEAEADRKAA